MNNSGQQNNLNNPEEISVKDLLAKLKSGFSYLKSKWITVLLVSLLGAVLGFCYSIFRKPAYTAVCTFVLDEAGRGGGLSQYAGLASLAGLNLGDGGGGIFVGDNILELYKSRSMIEKTLLSTGSFNGKNELLIDRYIDYNKLRQKWKSNDKIDSINFVGDPDKFSRKQDSIITNLTELFNQKVLDVTKPDKKLSIIKVTVTTKDELFSKCFTEKLVQTVNDFYIQTKTKKTSQSVQILQRQADSVKTLLNNSISGVASAIDAAPNANPLLVSLRVPSQRKQVDVQATTAIYGEIVKNLEIEKISLRQEMPLIQVIDKPILPLADDHAGKAKGIFIGAFFGMILTFLFIIVRRVFQIVLS